MVRRSIDRLWADQSIETCDDWVIPYIGDLLGTNLVHNLDARAQRLDVAKTIHYRRRKGTLEVLEELALDVTGWTAHVVEGFRRLARTRHGLDPAVGPAAFPQASPADVASLLQAEGLTGLLTGGPAGGFADLRSRHGAALANTAFDEGFHTADVRAGRGVAGHFGIPKLLVFLWRLTSFPVVAGTPGRGGRVRGPVRVRPDRPRDPALPPLAGAVRRRLRVLGPRPGMAGPRTADELPGDRDHRLGQVPAAGAATLSRHRGPSPLRTRGGWQLSAIWPETRQVRGHRPAGFARRAADGRLPVRLLLARSAPARTTGPARRPPGRRRRRDDGDRRDGLDTALTGMGRTGTVTIGDGSRSPNPSPTPSSPQSARARSRSSRC